MNRSERQEWETQKHKNGKAERGGEWRRASFPRLEVYGIVTLLSPETEVIGGNFIFLTYSRKSCHAADGQPPNFPKLQSIIKANSHRVGLGWTHEVLGRTLGLLSLGQIGPH